VCVATLLFEGDKDDVEQNERKIFKIAKKFRGFDAGAANGEKGYVSEH
jgi:alkyldihydroxyacetonephosphate synthase